MFSWPRVTVMNRQYLVGVLSMLSFHAPLLDIAQWYTARRQSTAPFIQCSKRYKIQDMTESLEQSTSVVTFDLVIYSKVKEIQWRYPEDFKNLVIRMGRFHVALNFLAVIGKKFQESGIEDVLAESGLYGSNTTMALLQGKSYNRGVRAHKLMMEALLRLQWEAFCYWATQEGEVNSVLVNKDIHSYRAASTSEERKDSYLSLVDTSKELCNLFSRFKQETSSPQFKFWDSYIKMVLLLL